MLSWRPLCTMTAAAAATVGDGGSLPRTDSRLAPGGSASCCCSPAAALLLPLPRLPSVPPPKAPLSAAASDAGPAAAAVVINAGERSPDARDEGALVPRGASAAAAEGGDWEAGSCATASAWPRDSTLMSVPLRPPSSPVQRQPQSISLPPARVKIKVNSTVTSCENQKQ